ncbi:MAG: hypothetical protein ACREPM_02975 [Gemmatimonadaceae bacterium]
MRRWRVGSHFSVFILFFGLSLVEAIVSRDWPMAAVFVVLAFAFLRADGRVTASGR